MKIFISYARANKDIVQDIPALLPFHDVWFDPNIHIGDLWWDRIKNKIEWCDCLLFVLSQSSINSEFCQKELVYAQELGKLIAPINIDNSPIPTNLSVYQVIEINEGKFLQSTANLINGLFKLERDTPIARIKRLITDDKGQIELEDILTESVKKSFNLSLTDKFDRDVRKIIRDYETNHGAVWSGIFELSLENTRQTLELFACLTWYGKPEQEIYLKDALVQWSKIPNTSLGKTVWQLLPTVLLIYVCGTLAIYRKKWDYILELTTEPVVENDDPPSQKTTYILERLVRTVYEKIGNTNQMNGGGSLFNALQNTSMTDLLKPLIHDLIGKYIDNQEDVDKSIDLFEMWMALLILKVTKKKIFHKIPSSSYDYIQSFWENAGREGANWQMVTNGFNTVKNMLDTLHSYQQNYASRLNCHSAYYNALSPNDLFNKQS